MMHQIAVSLMILFSVSSAMTQYEDKLQGEWVGKDAAQDTVTVTFGPKNSLLIKTVSGIAKGTYTVNAKQRPNRLDVKWDNNDGGSPWFFDLQGNTELLLAPPLLDGSPPDDFSGALLLKKK
ncbi:MAG TPA: hypothetical protein VE988_03400 [Gemmataceae bacterium]|nr:hypothetical protein [Gemmataceae bacterium]